MKFSMNRLSLGIAVMTLLLWVSQAIASGGNMNQVNNFCGSGTINNCNFCHTADPGTTQDTFNCGNNSADCSTNQFAFQQGQSNSGDYSSFCPSNAQCTTNADCDDNLFCNGAETCDGSGNCQPGTSPCTAGQACDEANHCMAGPECVKDADCDDGLFCNGTEICDGQNTCQSGGSPCAVGESCNETDGCVASPPAGSSEGETLYGDNCASCHGTDGSGGTADEDVRGESAKEITEAIGKVGEMAFLATLSTDEIDAIAAFLGNGGVQDGDSDEMDHNGDMKHDEDNDGISDVDEGKASTEEESEDADEDGTPDYMDPDVTHFDSDNNDGSMILMTDEGQLEGAATIDEATTLPPNGKPEGVVFKWGFVQFTVTGVTPGGSIDITLRMPSDLPAGAEYWKYDEQGYHKMDRVSVNGNEVTFTLTDDDNDGIIVDPGAVGVPVTTSGSSSGGGGGGCSLQTSGNSSGGLDPALFLILLLPLLLKGLAFRKDR